MIRSEGHVRKVKERKMAESLSKVTHRSLMEKVIFEQWIGENEGTIFSSLGSNFYTDTELETTGCCAEQQLGIMKEVVRLQG